MVRHSRPAKKKSRPAAAPVETQAANFMTTGWLIAVMTTLACEVFSVIAAWYHRFHPDNQPLEMLAGFLLFASLVTGTAALILAVVVWRARRVPPPPGITVFAVVVSLAPFLLLWLR
ncbi:MAG: hypothetical protein AB7O62_13955 [Pirellulales bacterium]